MPANQQGSSTSAGALVLTRLFDAPRDLVFRAWTDEKHLAQWWGPHHFTNPVCRVDLRKGGAIRIDMRGPDGTVYPMGGTFHEITPPERLVFTSTAVGGNLEILNTITFEDVNGKTRLTVRAEVVKAEAEAAFAIRGMEQGWTESLERLARHVANDDSPEFVISRTFDAPRELVWKAWTESERLAQWFGPKGAKIISSNNDLRTGGIYHYGMRTPDGTEIWGRWVYREIEEPSRLVFVNSFSDPEGGITRHPFAPDWPLEMLSTIAFDEIGGKTRITVRWSPINATELERNVFREGMPSMEQGWGGTLEQLTAYLASA